jgi:aminoglycoside/choline kinase family phosphotransferase
MTAERSELIRQFLGNTDWAAAAISPLPGDASTRRYFRVAKGAHSAILMDQPQNAEAPPCPSGATAEERERLGYNAVARLAGADCTRFIAVADYLRGRGLHAPQILAADPAAGFVLMEELKGSLYADAIAEGADEPALYAAAIEALALLHQTPAPANAAVGTPLFLYDETAQLAEVHLLAEWYLPLALGRPADQSEIAEHQALWRVALQGIAGTPTVFVHRDYHAQNLIWMPEQTGLRRVGIIDFQDAVAGSSAYDIISLLEDARRDVSASLKEKMTGHYLEIMKQGGHAVDAAELPAAMAVIAAQRNAKIAGIFARLCVRDGKPRYLGYLPRVWRYLERDLAHPALQPLRVWYDKTIPAETRHNLHQRGAAA